MGLLLEHALDIPTVVELSMLPLVEEPKLYFGSLDTPIVLIPKLPFFVVLKFFNNCNFLDYNSLFFTYCQGLVTLTYIIMAIILFCLFLWAEVYTNKIHATSYLFGDM